MIDRDLVIKLHADFPPGHVVDFFNGLRREKIFSEIKKLSEANLGDDIEQIRLKLEDNLCHPLLLPTAIAGTVLGLSEYENLLLDFLEGSIDSFASNFHSLYSLEPFVDDYRQIGHFFDCEHRYYRGVYELLLDSFRPGGKNTFAHCLHEPVADRLTESCYSTDGIRTFTKDYNFSPHDLRWNAWQIFNMPMVFLAGFRPGSMRECAVLYRLGFDNNSQWHNLSEGAACAYQRVKRIFNDTLRARDQERIAEAGERLKIAEYFMRRARRLYWWNPCEISAHRGSDGLGERFVEQFARLNEGKLEKGDP